ncbi:hypothetical protein METBIDRAFT_9355 [Metschnikowia bicuspidata var. bicuspidata NRRL YB-4993]|uniref:Uncharacterized protein n=1 Tax=Metschnikowia bicuspidata var. bicuspidata NRRL YB-4993 TaxID=869754 RepID=A0A1A0HFU8_9ASCO|nr:hypothetical protein METBIDRAFT_9355 [Metschnikowia bicuspidata var. bicuspidata NRRL YB-4993]OBA23034.1 hypothetical protein METBIDRAFT_9355 [Metschnikowia bicuspidata var. bicuspidata NRRL YB-4993]
MPYSCTSPTSTTEEDWINEIFEYSPFGNIHEDSFSPLLVPVFSPQKAKESAPEHEDLFSGVSSNNTSATTPGATIHIKDPNHQSHTFFDSVSCKLQRLKESNSLTPKALEWLFNTQDVLADSVDWQTEQKHRNRRSRAFSSQGLEGGPKSSCHLRQKAGSMHSQGLAKRRSSRGKTNKSIFPHGMHSLQTLPYNSRRSSFTNFLTYGSPENEPSSSLSVPQSCCESPFHESWSYTPYFPRSGAGTPGTQSTDFSGLGPSAALFDQENATLLHAEFFPISEAASRSDVSPIAEAPAMYSEYTGPSQQPATENCVLHDTAVQDALAYIDYLQEENQFQQARLEGVV